MPPPGAIENHRMKSINSNLFGRPCVAVSQQRARQAALGEMCKSQSTCLARCWRFQGPSARKKYFMKNTPQKSNLDKWITHPGADEYFGRRFAFKFAVLATIASGHGTLAEVARQYGSSRQAAWKHAKSARLIFGIVTA
jgi:hypothetical protein